MWFTRVSIHNPIFATMVMIAIMVLGVFAYKKLEIQQFPNINLPTIVITTLYPNAAPKAVEHDVSEKIEDAVNTIGGIDTLQSKSYQGKSVVIVRFNLETHTETDENEVREKIAAMEADLNENVGSPEIQQIDPDAQPVISVSVSSKTISLKELSSLVENTIVKRLEDIDGVGEADIVGARERQVNINVDPQKLNYYHLSVGDVVAALESDSKYFPTGTLKKTTTETNIQIESTFKRVSDFNHIVVARHGDQSIYLHQIATIEDGMSEQTSSALIDGDPAITIDVVKTTDANTVLVAKNIKAQVSALQKELPESVALRIVKDNSLGILASVNNVKETILEGALLTILVVFLFLSSWRSTVITALTLPIAVIGAFASIYAFGFTLNNMTLMALSLSIGILIDDAIVVRENISRHILLGKSHYQAALDGTKEIGLAVLATTSTLVAVFLPVAYMQGVIGRMFFEFGITVSVAVLLSLFVSYTLDPMLSSLWYDPHLDPAHQSGWLLRFTRWRESKMERFTVCYQKILRLSLTYRLQTLGIALGMFCASFLLLGHIGKEFIPQTDLGEVTVSIESPQGASLEYTTKKVIYIQKLLREIPDVTLSYATLNSKMAVGNNQAIIYVELKPRKERTMSAQALIPVLREKLKNIAGLQVMVGMTDSFGRAQRSIQVSVHGDNLDLLTRLTQKVYHIMRSMKGFVDVDNNLNTDKPVINLKIKRKEASDLGVTTEEIYNVVQPLFSGKEVGTWLAPDDNNYKVVVELSEKNRRFIQNIKDLYVASQYKNSEGNPIMIPLSQLVEINQSVMPSEIDHRNLTREGVVSGNVAGISEGEASIALYSQLDKLPIPKGYGLTRAGNDKKMMDSIGYASSALGLAVIFIYIILASQFASFTHPIVIMASLPLSLIGVFVALFLLGSTLNMFSVIGCIMLMGLVTKNAILLVDFINVGLRSGLNRLDAILDAGKIRMRPILMTTCAMIFGMLPLALGIGEGAEQRMSMAQAIIGGIITSTLLTLVIIPVIYTYVDDWSQAFLKRFARNFHKTR